jgi:predicted nucleic acid-binding protein
MTSRLSFLLILFGFIGTGPVVLVQADGEILGFAVVSEVPKDKTRVFAKVSVNDAVSDMKLLASEAIINNLIWKKLEICHAMRVEGYKVAEGFQIVTVHMIDAGMLPMSLQSFAGDCLIKKAIEIAPLVD